MPSPHMRVDEYPHKLSGGMRQRVMIAMALACAPALLIADEPTTALDVTIQAQILDLLRKLREETGTAVILITHDLGVVAETCDDVAVMYAGEIVELTSAQALFAAPQHPYTVGLLGSIPLISATRERLTTISGSVPTLSGRFTGCRFAGRCPFADAHCRSRAAAARRRRHRPPLALLESAARGSGGMTAASSEALRFASPCVEGPPSARRGGRAMRPRLRPAIADIAAHSTAGLSRWTHRVGVTRRARHRHPHLGTPSDLARRSARALSVAMGELSPWRSVLPPPHDEGIRLRHRGRRPSRGGSA